MLFNSPVFIFIFLPIVCALYWILPARARNLILLLCSLIFYTWGEQELVLIMLGSILVDFSAGLLIGKGFKKTGLILSILFNLGLLAVFKYADFIYQSIYPALSLIIDTELPNRINIPLPIGISFYTFQTMSYTIDVYRGNVSPTKNIIKFGTYVSLFPQLIAGPIVRYIDVFEQLNSRSAQLKDIRIGIERFIIGMIKKMLFANTFAEIADLCFSNPADISSPATLWIGIIAYSLQIYFDFSAYSDMAIGISRMFGFKILENFNYPYIAVSIQDFWRRWHISLSQWFRDYLYIPLGGSRVGKFRIYFNLIIVFFITGLWHGASWSFVVWGLYHGFFLILERLFLGNLLNKMHNSFRRIYVLLVVIFGWVFFRVENITDAILTIKVMCFIEPTTAAVHYTLLFNNFRYFIFGIGLILCTPIYHLIIKYIKEYKMQYFYFIVLLFLYFISLCFMAAGTYDPFIYFRF